eukprot:10671395-Ditylum_brightwellii.AAC.1
MTVIQQNKQHHEEEEHEGKANHSTKKDDDGAMKERISPHTIVLHSSNEKQYKEMINACSLQPDINSFDKDNIRTIFVGRKGRVGKTTISSSLTVTIASNYKADAHVLVVSTDPAHSLSDTLNVDLQSGQGEPIQMTDPLTEGRLHAAEVDPIAALNDFRLYLEMFDIDTISNAFGVSSDLLKGLGLRDFSGLSSNPPPGLDELVALSNVLDSPNIKNDYDVDIVDTAPT